jgi:REP element-mobilizing transposase RayT
VDVRYHVWFSTKGRQPILLDEFAREVKKVMSTTAQRAGIDLLEVEALFDHVHLLVLTSGTQTLGKVMHQLKRATARDMFLRYPDLRVDMQRGSLWQKGYGWRKVDESEVDGVRAYIRTQRRRPYRNKF